MRVLVRALPSAGADSWPSISGTTADTDDQWQLDLGVTQFQVQRCSHRLALPVPCHIDEN
jgi:hypothetical protein